VKPRATGERKGKVRQCARSKGIQFPHRHNPRRILWANNPAGPMLLAANAVGINFAITKEFHLFLQRSSQHVARCLSQRFDRPPDDWPAQSLLPSFKPREKPYWPLLPRLRQERPQRHLLVSAGAASSSVQFLSPRGQLSMYRIFNLPCLRFCVRYGR